jgi:hypothetical protein
MKTALSLWLLFLCTGHVLRAQAPPTPEAKPPVPITEEPHHHLILENPYVRVFRVEIISPDATLLHRHDIPYVYMSIGRAEFSNTVQGKAEVHAKLANGQLGYSKGGFAHIIRTENDTPFYNITVELLHPQGNVSSKCAKAVEGPLLGCSAAQDAIAETENKAAATSGANGTSLGMGADTPSTQAAPNNTQVATSTPPTFAEILETDESTLRTATFPAKTRTSLQGAPGGTLIVVEPLSQFKLDFSDGSSKLLSGGDPLWLQAGSSTIITNASDQTSSSILIFGFKDPPKTPGN